MNRLFVLSSAVFSCFGNIGFASGLDFTLVNATGYDILAVFIDPNSSNVWTDDIMGADILEHGEAVDISFAQGQDTCIWDLQVEWTEDYPPTVWYDFNLCDISEITLEYNRETDETIAYTK